MKLSTLFKLDIGVIAFIIVLMLCMADFSQPQTLGYANSRVKLGPATIIPADCITDLECGCINDCLDPVN